MGSETKKFTLSVRLVKFVVRQSDKNRLKTVHKYKSNPIKSNQIKYNKNELYGNSILQRKMTF